jgi:hypothetical protein
MTARILHTVPPATPTLRSARPPRPGRLKRSTPVAEKPATEPTRLCAIAARLAASHYDISLADIGARTRRSRRAARARHVAMYLAHVAFGLSLAAIGIAFGRSRRSTAHACARIEDARDDPAFDAAIAGLEISARILLDLERERKAA